MAYKFTKKNATKSSFRTQVSRKQRMFKRFKKQFATAKNPTMKRFCKTEASKIVRQLRTFAKQYRKFGFGASSWITKNCNMTILTSGNKTGNTRRNNKRTYGRRTTKTYGSRTRSWSRSRTNRTKTNRKSYASR